LCSTTQVGKSAAWKPEPKTSRDFRTDANRAFEDIAHLNRIVSRGQLAASLAHELAQPLAAILVNAQAALRLASLPDPDLKEIRAALADITQDDQRAQAVVQNMRAVFQKRRIAVKKVDLNRVVNDVIRLARNSAQLCRIRIRVMLCSESAVVLGDSVVLQQVLLNLINNGMDAMMRLPTERRILAIATEVTATSSRGAIMVRDNGSGVAEADKPKLFTPFFSTKIDGLGIGLSICRALIESIDGRISLENRSGPGAAFRVELPLATHEDDLSKVA
jgi:C4-dicarboxylate-specific signal transduction histidine kinase